MYSPQPSSVLSTSILHYKRTYRSPATDTAKTWLRKLGIDSHFKAIEVFGAAGKAQHFKKIKEKTGVAYSNMLFFDDEHPNIKVSGSLELANSHALTFDLSSLIQTRPVPPHFFLPPHYSSSLLSV